jgi:hypothetical protein
MNFLFKTSVSLLWCNLTVFWGYQESFPHGRQRAGFKNLKKNVAQRGGLAQWRVCLVRNFV